MLKLSTVSPSSCSPSSTSSSTPSTSTTSPPQVMRQLEGSRAASAMSSMAGSRSTTPLPHAPAPHPHLDHFDPHAEIRELHGKLEELRRLNYSLDVELQRERGERQELGTRWGQCKMAICFHFYLLNLIIYSNLFIFYCPPIQGDGPPGPPRQPGAPRQPLQGPGGHHHTLGSSCRLIIFCCHLIFNLVQIPFLKASCISNLQDQGVQHM